MTRNIGKSIRSAVMIAKALKEGKRVYHLSTDPAKCGEIVAVELPCEHEWISNIHYGPNFPADPTDWRCGCNPYKCKKCGAYSGIENFLK